MEVRLICFENIEYACKNSLETQITRTDDLFWNSLPKRCWLWLAFTNTDVSSSQHLCLAESRFLYTIPMQYKNNSQKIISEYFRYYTVTIFSIYTVVFWH